MKRLIVAAGLTGALILTGCGDAPSSVKPNSRCAKSQKGMEVTNPDGKKYECEKTGLSKRSYKWVLD